VSKFTPLRKGNPCPICDRGDGACREAEGVNLCITEDGSAPVPGWHFLGTAKNSLWGKFVPERDRPYSESERQEWRQQKQRQERERERLERERAARSMPVAERDRWYRRLLAELALDPVDRADLRRRGLSDREIAARGYRSVTPRQQLTGQYPVNLPGVSDGRVTVSGAGYLIPALTADGAIAGFQIRLRDAEAGRYRWVSSTGNPVNLPSGELPITIAYPSTPNPDRAGWLGFAEGILKPQIAADRLGFPVIGASGGNFGGAALQIQAAIAHLKPSKLVLLPDSGAVKNAHVLKQYRRIAELLQRLGYPLEVAWWGQHTKESPDPDELTDTANLNRIKWAEFEAIAHQHQPDGWLAKFKGTLSKFLAKHTPKLKPSQGFAPAPAPATTVEYEAGARIKTWGQLIEQDHTVLDTSLMGLGKSFDAGACHPSDFRARQLIYVSNQHRNPTTKTLDDGWEDLEARHGGLTAETTPNGGHRLKRSQPGETPNIAANCSRHRIAGVLRDKAVQGADTASLICGTCPLREACTHAQGSGYGFLNQRRSALASPRLRSHPDSLPSPTDYDYSETVLLWDEFGESQRFKKTVAVNLQDLEQTIGALMPHSSFTDLQGLLNALLSYLNESKPTGRYGLSHTEVVDQLPNCAGLEVDAIAAAIHPDLSFLNTTEQYGVDLQDLPPSLRKKFAERDGEIAEKTRSRVIKQWLPLLLQVLQGTTRGNLSLHRGTLTITIPDQRHQAILQACKGVILLDGTLDPVDLALITGIPVEKITVARQRVDTPENLMIQQVSDIGRLSMQRGEDQKKRVKAIINQIKQEEPTARAIDFLKFQDEGMGAWWRDSRGSNDFTNCQTLILIGTPCRNLADLQADFAILTGSHDFDSEEFAKFCDRRIRADIHQGIYRLRPHRRPTEQLKVIVLSDFDLGLPNVTQIAAKDITPLAASKFEQFQIAATAAIAQLREAGAKVTQAAVSAICGYSQQYLSRHWHLLQTLLETSNSKSGKNSGAPPDPETEPIIEAIAGVVNEVATLQNPQILIETLEIEVFPNLPDHLIAAFLARLSDSVWQLLVTALLPIVGIDELEAISS